LHEASVALYAKGVQRDAERSENLLKQEAKPLF
jgi:hypothetical protein